VSTNTPIYAAAYMTTTGLQKQTDPCTPCSACGGLECLCRPRFYAGQLLTEQDLNRLDHYIVEKNKLHNRFLMGWGVACGLEVVCNPCGNLVLVRPGYALDRCGNDVVVCQETTVDICSLISGCCSPPADDCNPPRPRPTGCDDLEQKWVLEICYRETPSRGAIPLKTPAPASSCGCGCGGKGGGSGCGCGGSSKPPTSTTSSKLPSQCEPTVTCEGYYFKVYPAPVPTVKGGTTDLSNLGALAQRAISCILALYQSIPPVPTNPTVPQLQQWCCSLRSAILTFLASRPGTRCDLLASLNTLCPDPGPNMTPQQYLQVIASGFVQILLAIFKDCLCSALLPPCPEVGPDPCVPIATITVRGKDCKILRICNLENRKFLMTFPNLQYWLSWLPYVRELRALIEKACCTVTEVRKPSVTGLGQRTFGNLQASAFTPERQSASLSASILRAFTAEAPVSTVQALALDALGLADDKGNPFLSTQQAANPLASVFSEQFIVPVLTAALPEGAAGLFSQAGGADLGRLAADIEKRNAEVGNLQSQLDSMQKTIQTQQATIEGLAARLVQFDKSRS
jgi:hypothetical protein